MAKLVSRAGSALSRYFAEFVFFRCSRENSAVAGRRNAALHRDHLSNSGVRRLIKFVIRRRVRGAAENPQKPESR